MRLRTEFAQDITASRQREPVLGWSDGQRRWWWWGESSCWENHGYGVTDVAARLTVRARRHDRRLGQAHAVMAAGRLPRQSRRDHIPAEVRRAVFERDGGACVECAATFDLQCDHVIAVALGGASSAADLQLLCGSCNRSKGAALA